MAVASIGCTHCRRYTECKAVLRDDKTFISGKGVALNRLTNRLSRGTTLNSDGAEHDQRRKLVAHRLLPRALRGIDDNVQEQAGHVVDAALARGEIDGVEDLACALPMAVVPDLIGWPREQRDNLLPWGAATFDILGPMNRQASEIAAIQPAYAAASPAASSANASLIEGSVGHEVLLAADEGKVPHAELAPLMIDYIAPSLDTTISAISNALHLFATHPEQWRLLKEDPTLIPNAVNEIIRYESPLRAFSRHVARDTDIAGHSIPAGARVLVIYASANRDEREWDSPDTSTSGATPPVSSASAMAPTPAPDRAGAAGNPGHAAGSRRTGRADRTGGAADLGAQQHHPPTRAATAEADRGLDSGTAVASAQFAALITELPKRSIVSSTCARLSPGSPTCTQVTPTAASFSRPAR